MGGDYDLRSTASAMHFISLHNNIYDKFSKLVEILKGIIALKFCYTFRKIYYLFNCCSSIIVTCLTR